MASFNTLGLRQGQWLLDSQGRTWKLIDIVAYTSVFNPTEQSLVAVISFKKKKVQVSLSHLDEHFTPVMSPLIKQVLEFDRLYNLSTGE